jgi:hypothetical protein
MTSTRTAGAEFAWNSALASVAGLTAILAWAGTLGVLLRVVAVDSPPVAAAIDIAIFLALPMTFTAWLAADGHRRAAPAAVASGAIVIVWIGAELAFLQMPGWVYPVLASIGAAVFTIGLVLIMKVRSKIER